MKLEIGKWILTITLTDEKHRLDEQAEAVRKEYESGILNKVEAVKKLRDVFRDVNPDDVRFSLRGAVEYVTRTKLS